tara:strand:- start:667 stop:1701 length:1035 start_codon:yes stop_codon:yes gene_type:complete
MMDKPEEFIPGRVPVDENANKKLSFTSDVHGNTRMLRDFFSYSLNELNCDYVILGGDLGPRGEGIGDKETVEYHYGEMMKQKRWFEEQFCDLVETFFPASSIENKKEETKKKKQKLFLVLGNSDWQINECVLKRRFHTNDSVKVCSGLGDVFVEDECIEFFFTAIVSVSNHRKKDFERKDIDAENVPEKNQNGFVSRFGNEKKFEVDRYLVNDACTRPTFAETLANLQPKMVPASASSSPLLTKVWVNHGPPFDTIGDLTHRNERVGSKALRSFIAEHQPDITLHGHIHESVLLHGGKTFNCQIGNTIVASSGNDFMSDVCHGIFFETKDIQRTLMRFEVKVGK